MQRHGDAVGRHVDPLDQQPWDACLLGRVELVPYRLERPEGFDHLALLKGRILCLALLAHRSDGPRDQLGRREQPPDLAEDEAFDLAGGDRAHRAAIVPPAAGAEADVVAVQPAAPPRVGRRHGRATVRAAHQTPERRRRPGPRLVAPALGVRCKDLVHPLPGRAVDDRLVLARVDLALVHGLAEVDAIRRAPREPPAPSTDCHRGSRQRACASPHSTRP
jgi:hypothetical protein